MLGGEDVIPALHRLAREMVKEKSPPTNWVLWSTEEEGLREAALEGDIQDIWEPGEQHVQRQDP